MGDTAGAVVVVDVIRAFTTLAYAFDFAMEVDRSGSAPVVVGRDC